MLRVAAVAFVLLVATPVAGAGGDFVDLVVAGSRVWTVGDFGIRSLDVRSGRSVYSPAPAAARYDLSVAVAGGAAFVASVANGYTNGEVTRIDLRTHATTVVWRRANASAQYVAAGAGGIYVLVGAVSGNTVVRFSTAGRMTGRWAIAGAGRIAADASGCWVSATHHLLHIRPDGRVVDVLSAGIGDVATGGGAAWLEGDGSIVRVDERTGMVQTLHTPGLEARGLQHDLAVGSGYLWTSGRQSVQRRDLRTGRVEKTLRFGENVDALAIANASVWVATPTAAYRIDARRLRRTLSVPLV